MTAENRLMGRWFQPEAMTYRLKAAAQKVAAQKAVESGGNWSVIKLQSGHWMPVRDQIFAATIPSDSGNSDSPRCQHPFTEGVNDRLLGKDEYDCPYPSDSADRAAWQHGWEHADETAPPLSEAIY